MNGHEESDMEARVWFHDKEDLWFDRVEIYIDRVGPDEEHWESNSDALNFPDCVRGYEKKNYEGQEWTWWCGNLSPSDWNDKLESFQIPQGLKLTLYENSDKTGESVVLTGDVPDLGDFKDKISLIEKARFDASKCNIGYEDSNFQGNKTYFCPGENLAIYANWNDKLSSFKIAPDRKLRACTNIGNDDGGYGLCRTYFEDVSNLGFLEDKISLVNKSDFNSETFVMVMMSDPQYGYCNDAYCAEQMDALELDKDPTVVRLNQWHTQAIKKIKTEVGSRFAGVIINGDLTNEINSGQLDKYRADYEDRYGFNVYPGLGNHDYDNWQRSNGSTRLDWFREGVIPSIPVTNKHINGNVSPKVGTLSYSFDIGPWHFVQLNNDPTFERTIYPGLLRYGADYDITHSVDWLRADLLANAGKPTILNFHMNGVQYEPWNSTDCEGYRTLDKSWGYESENQNNDHCDYESVSKGLAFHKVLEDYSNQIKAIFVGHLHNSLGQTDYNNGFFGTPSNSNVEIPRYFGGGAGTGNFLQGALSAESAHHRRGLYRKWQCGNKRNLGLINRSRRLRLHSNVVDLKKKLEQATLQACRILGERRRKERFTLVSVAKQQRT